MNTLIAFLCPLKHLCGKSYSLSSNSRIIPSFEPVTNTSSESISSIQVSELFLTS